MRDHILDATERVLSRLGYQKMTLDEIAREAGIARQTISLHFRSKEALALGTIDRMAEWLETRLCDLAGANLPWDERLRQMLVARVLFRLDSVLDHDHSLEEIVRPLRASYLARRAGHLAAEAAIFARVLAAGRAVGAFEVDDVDAMAAALLLATDGLVPSSLSPPESTERGHVEANTHRVAELLVRGLRTQVRPKRSDSRSGTSARGAARKG
jgi:AcrR family transcriptional regulator